ncbi:MAG: threonylcarbamoyl-AMP synthase [Holosporales bacterium]|jgi:L-threonylcarbamoyladenylate synthase|nr:threonylcarbamoyl-AMP synthase [Holosporales bacterium]
MSIKHLSTPSVSEIEAEDKEQVSVACAHLAQHEVVAIPTETVYGLAADATSDLAVAKIYAVKNRPLFNPLILHTYSIERALEIGVFSTSVEIFASKIWAPTQHKSVTLVVPLRQTDMFKLATAGLSTVGIRIPNHPVTSELLRSYPNPLAAPSANISTQISATNADIVRKSLGNKVAHIIDGGQCKVGLESTIIDASVEPYTVLRLGGASIDDIADMLGYFPQVVPLGSAIKAPGMQKRHYAPSIPLYTDQIDSAEGEAFLGFGEYDKGPYNLSLSGNLVEAAANLFRLLSELDDSTRFSAIKVAPIPHIGLGNAINDRLSRASSTE